MPSVRIIGMSHVSKKAIKQNLPREVTDGVLISKDNPVHEGAGGGGSKNVLELNHQKTKKKKRGRESSLAFCTVQILRLLIQNR